MEKRNKINKMKGEYTKKQAKVLRFYKFSVTLPEPNRRRGVCFVYTHRQWC